ncbi:phage antirepressor KilAC domain-containing protein [Nitrosomonas oligotropha]|uniref:phage antirepressor KilAC domain-containing protein n=1 Tax=Nitrosomonas oligotropha TaxID=42354 RepID=UPI00196136D3|nr:phage regulatory protein/antirepressor Ant [Nitrosomonas oligotropha]
MNNLINIANSPNLTMSSREIAELTSSTHDNVLKTIRSLASKGVVSGNETPYIHPQNGQTYQEIRLSYRDTMVVVSGYSVELRAKIIDRWQELEHQVNNPIANLSRKDLLKLALESEEENERLRLEVKELAPKAEALDLISADKDALTITEVAKILGMKRKDLTARLNAEGWIYRLNGAWVAYDRYIKNGYLTYKEAKYTDETSGQECRKPYCHVTPKGLARLAQILSIELEAA